MATKIACFYDKTGFYAQMIPTLFLHFTTYGRRHKTTEHGSVSIREWPGCHWNMPEVNKLLARIVSVPKWREQFTFLQDNKLFLHIRRLFSAAFKCFHNHICSLADPTPHETPDILSTYRRVEDQRTYKNLLNAFKILFMRNHPSKLVLNGTSTSLLFLNRPSIALPFFLRVRERTSDLSFIHIIFFWHFTALASLCSILRSMFDVNW